MCAGRKASGRWVRIPLSSSSTHRMASISASCGSFSPQISFYFLPKKIFCRHCVLTVFQPFKLCYYLLWHDMARLIWIDLTYPLNSNCYCSLHTVTESLDQKSAGPRVMCEKRKVLTFQAWVSVHLTLWGSHARWRVAFIVTKTNAGQTDRLTWTFQVCASIALS